MRAVSQDKDASKLMGIDVEMVITFTFAVGGRVCRRRGASWPASPIPGSSRTWASSPASRRSSPQCWAASATCRAAMLGAFIMGLAETFATAYNSLLWGKASPS